METENSIYFYSHTSSNYKYMSNFYPCTFYEYEPYNTIQFNCTEQYLMYQKAKLFEPINIDLQNNILRESSPSIIKKIGRSIKNYDDNIWSQIRYDIMLKGLRLKFAQNSIISQELLKTYPKILYEASKNDKIWGIGFDSNEGMRTDKTKYGTNLLGKALMQIRDEIMTNSTK